jgi:hypothetical protein
VYATTISATAPSRERNWVREWGQSLLLSALWVAVVFFLLPGLAHATGTGSGTGTATGAGGATAAQARVLAVATGWQNIVQGVGVVVLIIAWSYVGYQIAFGGKTMKDMFPTMVGTSIAGLSPVLVGWMFS